jgi:7-cyano-7-deazaguanine synthase
MPKAYVLLSGGVDSSTALAMANEDWDGRVCGVGVNYGQRHTKELEQARRVATHFQNQFIVRDITGFIQKGGLTDEDLDIPPVSYDDLPKGVSPTYVPFRNGTMLSLIAGMAAVDDEAEAVYIGVHAEDAENWAYPDCTPEFIGGMANAIYIGTYHKIRLHAPLIWLKKHEVVEQGEMLGVPWIHTWSCYEGKPFHCGVCPTCRARIQAFADAKVPDPTTYEVLREDEIHIPGGGYP